MTLRQLLALLDVHIRLLPKYGDEEDESMDSPTDESNTAAIREMMKW